MRTLDATLTTAQQAASRSPYVRLYFDDRGGTTVTYTTRDATNRIYYVEQWEEGWAGVAIIRLRNHDQGLSAVDYRGYSVSIGWGMVLNSTPDSTWYSNAAVMKVIMQRDISFQGELLTEFYCVSIWEEIRNSIVLASGVKVAGVGSQVGAFTLGETITTTGLSPNRTGKLAGVGNDGTNDYIIVVRFDGSIANWNGATTVGGATGVITLGSAVTNYGPMVYASGDTTTEARIEAITGLTVDVDADDPDGSMADTPKLEVPVGVSSRAVIRHMMMRTKCGLRYENDGKIHALYLDTATAVQYEFQSTHAFFEDLRDRAIILPNAVVFVDALPDTQGKAASYIGTANDATSVSAIGTFTTIQVDPDITSDAEGNTRAAAWIAQKVAQAYQGKVTAPMECGLEVYDMVQCVDARLNVTTKGRIGRLERYYHPAQGRYEFICTLGSVYSEPGAMGVGPGGVQSDLTDLTDDLDRSPPVVKETVMPWQLGQAVQPYVVDMTFTPGGSSADKNHIAWAAASPGILFKDGTTLNIDANTNLDITAGAGWLYFTEGSATLTYTQTYADCVAPTHGLVAYVAPGTETGNTAVIIPFSGKSPSINADLITCIQLSAISANVGTLTAGTIEGVVIRTTSSGDFVCRYGGADVGYIYGISGGGYFLGNTDVFVSTAANGGIEISAGELVSATVANDALDLYAKGDGRFWALNGISIKAGSAPTAPTLDDLRLEADDELHIRGDRITLGSGTSNPSGAANSITIDAENDVNIYADDDVLIDPTGSAHINNLESTSTDITGSRALDAIYRNLTEHPIICLVTVTLSNSSGEATAFMELADATPDVVVGNIQNEASGAVCDLTLVFYVPVNAYYKVADTSTDCVLVKWHEVVLGSSSAETGTAQ